VAAVAAPVTVQAEAGGRVQADTQPEPVFVPEPIQRKCLAWRIAAKQYHASGRRPQPQLTVDEISYIAEQLYERTTNLDEDPRSLLSFGVADAPVWVEINCEGRTVLVDETATNSVKQVQRTGRRPRLGTM
jgi:hypothetical protein